MPINYNDELRIARLKAASAAVEEMESNIATYRDFYGGEQGLELTDRQKEYLKQTPESIANICKRVVGITVDRLSILEDGIMPVDDASKAYAETALSWWTDENTSDEAGDFDPYSLQSDIYEAGGRDGLTAVVVDWDEEQQRPTMTPNLVVDGASTGLIRFHYDDNNRLLFASKRWTIIDPTNKNRNGNRRLTIYTPGTIERYESAGGSWNLLQPEEIDGLPNPQWWTDSAMESGDPLGIPVIPFDNPTGSELADILTLQEILNHNVSNFDISVDMHAHPMLAFFGFNFPVDSNGYSTVPKLGPGSAVNAATSDGRVDRIEPADLARMFESGVLSWVQILALIKGWPMYLFDRNQQPPSGVALSIMEQSLVSQIERKQRAYSGAWRAAFNMARKLHKVNTGEDLQGQIKFNWKPAATKDPLLEQQAVQARAQALQTLTAAGASIAGAAAVLGYTTEQIEQLNSVDLRGLER